MADDVIKIEFEHSEYIDLTVGDFIVFNNSEYRINIMPTVKKLAKNSFEYTCEFEGNIYQLAKVIFQFEGRSDFQFSGTAADFLTLCVTNLNRAFSGYSEGGAVETDYFTLDFENENLLSVINRLRDEMGIEFSLVGKTLHFQETGQALPHSFKVGRYQGMYDLLRKNVDKSNIVTRLWAFGSEKNLPADYTGKRLVFENTDLNNENRVENNISLYGLCEHAIIFEDIFPRRIGTITGVDAENNLVLFDTSIDFNINEYLLPGLVPKINFKTGALAGITFEFNYEHSTDKITLISTEQDGVDYPNESQKPAAGDTYVIYDIEMPQLYQDNAKLELREKADEWMEVNSIPKVIYELNIDSMYIRLKEINFNIGDYIIVIDEHFGTEGLLRITSINQNINNPNLYKIQVGDLKSGNILVDLNKNVRDLSRGLNSTNKVKADTTNVYNKTTTNTLIENNKLKWR